MAKTQLDEQAIFEDARQIESPKARQAFVEQACGDDTILRQRVAALLEAHDQNDSYLESPAIDLFSHRDVLGDSPTIDRPIAEVAGTRIGPYKLLEQIGEGGFGVVFLAEQERPVRRRVALKVIKPGMDTRQVIARFEAERQALAMMDHPNIAKVFDTGTTETGRPYFVMELVQGVPITEYCDQCGLTTRERLELFITVCQAVQHAHQKGIIHRDIKPTNLLVAMQDGKPSPKIIDFGVAKALHQRLTERTLATGYAQMIGTPLYMSPEQAELSPLGADTRSDIYSLGVLLYELLTGFTPFDKVRLHAASYDELRRILREEVPPRPSARISTLAADLSSTVAQHRRTDTRRLLQTVHGELDWIVMKALEKDRARRYDTASNFAEDVERFLHDEAVEACPPSTGYQFRKFARRNKTMIATTTAVSVALVVGVVGTSWQAVNATKAEAVASKERQLAEEAAATADQQKELALRQRDLTLENLYRASIPLAYQCWKDGNLNRMSEALMAFLPDHDIPDQRGWEWYYLASLLVRDDNVLRTEVGPIEDVYYSPGGKLMAVGGARDVVVYDAKSKRLIRSLKGGAPIAWHPKELQLVTTTKRGTPGEVTIWDISTGKSMRRLEAGDVKGIFIEDIAWTPDGKTLAWGGFKRFMIWREGEDSPEVHVNPRVDSPHGITALAWSPDGKLLTLALSYTLQLAVWNTHSSKFLEHIEVAGGRSDRMRRSAANDQLAISTKQGDVYGWNVEEREQVFYIPFAHGGQIRGLAWSPDGSQFATGGDDQLLKIWDTPAQRQINQIAGHRSPVCAVDWSPDGSTIATGDEEGTVRFWRPDDVQAGLLLPGGDAFAWAPNGKQVATVVRANDSRPIHELLIHDVESGEILQKIVQDWPIDRLAWSPDGSYIGVVRLGSAIYSGERVRVWDAKSGGLVHELTGIHTDPDLPFTECRCIAWSPHARMFATCGMDQRAKIWETNSAKLLHTLEGHDGSVGTVAWSPNGQWFLSADWMRHVKIWDAHTWDTLWELRHPAPLSSGADGTYSSAWSPDSRRIVTRSGDGDLVVWELMPGKEPRQIWTARAHSSNIRSVSWSPDGRRIASSSEDSLVKIWDAASGRELLTFDLDGWVATVAWSPDGTRLAAADRSTKPIHVWDARNALGTRWEKRKSRLKEDTEDPEP